MNFESAETLWALPKNAFHGATCHTIPSPDTRIYKQPKDLAKMTHELGRLQMRLKGSQEARERR